MATAILFFLEDNCYIYYMNHLLERITTNPNICHGKACIRNMRWPVENVIDLIASGMTFEEILADHPELERDDILAALGYAKITLSGKSLIEVS